MGNLLANKSLVFKKDQTIYQPTVYNVEFRNYASLQHEYSTSKLLMNSTSMRMKMN